MATAAAITDRGPILTNRQRQVLRLQAYGLTYQQISDRLGVSIWTVKNHHTQGLRSLGIALKAGGNERVRTSLACYILGLLDGGLTPQQIARRLREVSATLGELSLLDEPDEHSQASGAGDDVNFVAS